MSLWTPITRHNLACVLSLRCKMLSPSTWSLSSRPQQMKWESSAQVMFHARNAARTRLKTWTSVFNVWDVLTGRAELEKPLHLVIGSVTPTSVLLSWGTLLKTPYEGNIMDDCMEDGWVYTRCRHSRTQVFLGVTFCRAVFPQTLHGALSWEEQEVELPDLPNQRDGYWPSEAQRRLWVWCPAEL